jgi:hypothetical protein
MDQSERAADSQGQPRELDVQNSSERDSELSTTKEKHDVNWARAGPAGCQGQCWMLGTGAAPWRRSPDIHVGTGASVVARVAVCEQGMLVEM